MIGRILKWTALGVFLAIVLAPLLWLLLSSFKSNSEFFTNPLGAPQRWTFINYVTVLTQAPMLLYLFNSLLVAVLSTLFGALIALLASFVFLLEFPFKRFFYLLMVFGLFVPTSAFMIPYFLLVSKLGLYDTDLGIALVYVGIATPTGFLIVNTYMRDAVRTELIEASCLDGASLHQSFLRIVAPISMRGVATACVFLVIMSWNELLYALLLSQGDQSRTVQVAISFLVATYAANFPNAFAAMIIAMLPIVIIYIFVNKQIVSGLGMAVGMK